MEPLATINGGSPLIAPQSQMVSLGAPRGSQEERAPDKERAIELVADRVDPEDPVAQPRRSRETSTPGTEPSRTQRVGLPNEEGSGADTSAERDNVATQELSLAVAPKNQAVTYRVLRDLNLTQGQVIDRQNDEVVRSVPTEPQIELAQRYDEYIGKNIDTIA